MMQSPLEHRFSVLWHHMSDLGLHYGVDPLLFAGLYLAHHPLFWGTMAWLAVRVRQKRPVRAIIALAVFFWVMPYAYILVFGHGLPWWAYLLALIALIVGGQHAFREIRNRIKAPEVG